MAAVTEVSVPALSVAGVRLAAVQAGIRYAGRLDLVLIELDPASHSAGVFTRNAFCAAPVTVARRHLAEVEPRYLVINTGNANAGTGKSGLAAAETCCRELALQAGCEPAQVLPFSTGVIGEPLPVERLLGGLPNALSVLARDNWEAAARGIMTTDTRPKLVSRQLDVAGKTVTISGIAKGAGMIRPDMATMLAFVFTDAEIARPTLQSLLARCVARSFNRITVDGDTSTNDSCILSATGASGVTIDSDEPASMAAFSAALEEVFVQLATELIRDAEGASKFVTIHVNGGRDSGECLQVAYCVAESPLVKTALFASDPNWGRILAAVGRAGLESLDLERVAITLGDTLIVSGGERDSRYEESLGQAEMNKADIVVTIELGRGDASETVWTSDLSHEYVRINAEYRS